jgi:hypothetical protein
MANRTESPMVLRTLYIAKNMDDQLRRLAFVRGTSKNDLIRQGIHEVLSAGSQDLARFADVVSAGPQDLASFARLDSSEGVAETLQSNAADSFAPFQPAVARGR